MSDLANEAQRRFAESALIDNEWEGLSYKDRALWWMSAKWHGYMSAEAYKRGDPILPDISSRFGEPGFFIATRIPYFDTPVLAVAAEGAAPSAAPEGAEAVAAPVAAPVEGAALCAAPVIETKSTDEAGAIVSERAEAAVNVSMDTPKKKNVTKKNSTEGKTIEIRLRSPRIKQH